MPRWPDTANDWDDDPDPDLEDDDADPDDSDSDDDDDDATVACPHCRRAIYEDAERCPYCEHYLSREDAPVRKPWWLVLGVGVCLYVVYRWIVPW